jgi:hypothetical protein
MLWISWIKIVWELRTAFFHTRTFSYAVVELMGFSTRHDLFGVTSFVRSTGIRPRYYQCFLDFFPSTAINLQMLITIWVSIALRIFKQHLVTFNGRVVLLADGIKVPKTERKMPGVKLLTTTQRPLTSCATLVRPHSHTAETHSKEARETL